MPFGSITVNSKTFDPRQTGTYSLSTVTFGQPANEIRLRGASLGKDGLLRASATRLLEKDVTVGDQTVRKQCVVSFTIATPVSDFTGTEIDVLISDLSEFATATTISRLLQGES